MTITIYTSKQLQNMQKEVITEDEHQIKQLYNSTPAKPQ